jgi:hypothetical protein
MKAEESKEYLELHEHAGAEMVKRRAAVLIGILAMLLAICSLGGANATKEMINANISASDAYAFYQAKTIRQTVFRVAADELEITLITEANIPEAAREKVKQRVQRYWQTIERYDSEPSTGEGRKELLAKAQYFEAKRDHAQTQDPYFDMAEALFQIAIVLTSVSIIASSILLMAGGVALGAVATLLMLNGFFLVVHIPLLG